MAQYVTIDREENFNPAKLKVVGVGGGGCNAIESMIKRGLNGVDYVAINTDAQILKYSNAQHKIQVGANITKGLGAGADPKKGRQAVEENREEIEQILAGSDMVFITAGMGGGTGTGGAPIVASIAKSLGALVVGIVTKPFKWEGKQRMINAEQGIKELKQFVDSLIVIPNDRLMNILDKSVSVEDAFDKPNEVLFEATRGISDIITVPGVVNVDFADVRYVMSESGDALIGCGIASGENRAVEAAHKAINSPLLEGINIKGAKKILLNVTSSGNLTHQEINEGNEVIYKEAGEEANVIFGWVKKDDMNEYVSYTVIATGFNSESDVEEPSEKDELPLNRQEFKHKAVGMDSNYPFVMDRARDLEDINAPTFYRRGGSQNINLGNQKTNTAKGNDSFDWNDDEEDSSEFLKSMMD